MFLTIGVRQVARQAVLPGTSHPLSQFNELMTKIFIRAMNFLIPLTLGIIILAVVVGQDSAETSEVKNAKKSKKVLVLEKGSKATRLKIDRTVLPIPRPKFSPITEVDARKAKAPPQFKVNAPKDAPNVVIVLIDDIGFGTPSSFEGGVRTPTLDRLGKNGLRYNQFHTTAICSPTRMAILTGRNHHSAYLWLSPGSCHGLSR